jgi:hypothetical protein
MAYSRWIFGVAFLIPSSVNAQTEWAKMPRMQLERQFAGPLQDTIIQRWRDPVDGTVCYIYLPISAPHSAPQANGYVQYGSNTIGSLSCAPPSRPPAAAPAQRPKGETSGVVIKRLTKDEARRIAEAAGGGEGVVSPVGPFSERPRTRFYALGTKDKSGATAIGMTPNPKGRGSDDISAVSASSIRDRVELLPRQYDERGKPH